MPFWPTYFSTGGGGGGAKRGSEATEQGTRLGDFFFVCVYVFIERLGDF